MTLPLSERLRAVLSGPAFATIVQDDSWESELIEAPVNAIIAALLPLLTDLQAEQGRAMREDLTRETELRRAADRHAKECAECVNLDTWAIDQIQDIGRSLMSLKSRLIQAGLPLWAEDVSRLLARLAVSSSGAQEKVEPNG